MKILRGLVISLLLLVISYPLSAAAEEWVADFDKICALTNTADDLSVTELQKLITDCESLEKTISGSDSPRKKVYLFRLKKCRNFFAFLLETKTARNN